MTYSHNGLPVFLLELPESTAIDYACNNISHVKGLPKVGTNDTMKFVSGVQRVFRDHWWLMSFVNVDPKE